MFGVLDCAEEAGSVAEDMIIDTEVYRQLKFGHPRDGGMCAMLVTRRAVSECAVHRFSELDQGVLPRCE